MELVVLLTGVPGTGKSELTRALCDLFEGALCLSVSEVALAYDLTIAHDFVRKTFVVDEDRLDEKLKELVRGRTVSFVESVDPCLLQGTARLVVVTRCSNIDELASRLARRGWTPRKIEENVEAELLGLVELHAYSCHGRERVTVVDTCTKSIEQIATDLAERISIMLKGDPSTEGKLDEGPQP